MKLVGICLVLVATVYATVAHAQSYAQEVWSQLQRAYDSVRDDDFFMENYILGKLNQGGTDTWTFPLQEGREYMIIGACDNDCTDVDISVKDADDKVVVKDDATDDQPVTRFSVESSGRFTIEVGMFKCSDEPCFFGFGLFYK